MRDFELTPEVAELAAAGERLGTTELEPAVRDNESAGRWPGPVLDVLEGFPLTGLELAERLGGVGADTMAKVVLLEVLATSDAGGLPAADRIGPSVGALEACPDRASAGEVAASCLSGDAACAFTVTDPELGALGVQWAPSWPGVRWVWETEGDTLRLHEVVGDPQPVVVLAFGASGAVGVDADALDERGTWELSPRGMLDVRARARLWGAAVSVGIAAAALAETIEYTTDRVVFGKPVAHHQGNAFDIAAAAARVHAARLVVRDAAASFDRGEPDAGFWATQAWIETVEAAFDATNLGIQLHGGHGFIVDHLAEKRFREARMLALSAGGRDAAEVDVSAHVLDIDDMIGDAVTAGGSR